MHVITSLFGQSGFSFVDLMRELIKCFVSYGCPVPSAQAHYTQTVITRSRERNYKNIQRTRALACRNLYHHWSSLTKELQQVPPSMRLLMFSSWSLQKKVLECTAHKTLKNIVEKFHWRLKIIIGKLGNFSIKIKFCGIFSDFLPDPSWRERAILSGRDNVCRIHQDSKLVHNWSQFHSVFAIRVRGYLLAASFRIP